MIIGTDLLTLYEESIILKKITEDTLSTNLSQNGTVVNWWTSSNGKYLYYAIIPNGGDIIISKEDNILITGIHGELNEKATTYPNPFIENINFSNNGYSEFSVMNIEGEEIHKGKLQINQNRIYLSHLPVDVYFLTLQDSKNHLVTSIIKN